MIVDDPLQAMLFEHPLQPAAPQAAPVVQARRARKTRIKQRTFAEIRPEAFKKSLKRKYREPRSDVRERIAAIVLIAAQRVVKQKFVGNRSDRDDIVSDVALGALPRAYRWKRGGSKSIEQYAYGCCLFAFYDVMRERNADPKDDALFNLDADRRWALIFADLIVDERTEPTFETEEE